MMPKQYQLSRWNCFPAQWADCAVWSSHLVLVWYYPEDPRGIAWRFISESTGAGAAAGRRWRTRRGGCSVAARAAPANIWTDPEGARASILAAAGAALAEAGGGALSATCGRCSGSPAPTCRRRPDGSRPVCPSRRRGSRRDALSGAQGRARRGGRDHRGARHRLGLRGAAGRGGADDRRLGLPARRPGQRRADRAAALLEAALLAHDGLGGRDAAARARSLAEHGRAGGARRLRPARRARRTSPASRRGCSPRRPRGDPGGRRDPRARRRATSRGRSTGCWPRGRCRSAFLGGLGPVFAARLAGPATAG